MIVLQKKAIRHLFNAKYNSHTTKLFFQSRCLKLTDIYKLQCCKLGYKRKINRLPIYHASRLQYNHELRHRSTRQDDSIALEIPNNLLEINSLNLKIGSAWNEVPSLVKINLKRKKSSEKAFATRMKNYTIKDYNVPCSIPSCYICNRLIIRLLFYSSYLQQTFRHRWYHSWILHASSLHKMW